MNSHKHPSVRAAWSRPWLCVVVALVAAIAALGAACGGGGGGGDKKDVEAAVQAAIDAWNGKDVDAFLAAFTDNGLQDLLQSTREEAAQFLADEIGQPSIVPGKLSSAKVSGDTATEEALDFVFGKVLSPQRFSLVKEGGQWRIDATEDLTAEIPGDVTAIDLQLKEYAFDFDKSAITSGAIAFSVSNAGEEKHEVSLAKIPADLDLQQALRSQEEPPGIEDIGNVEALDPGADSTIVLTEPLEPGRYVLVCFVQAPDGTPHALKGMVEEFTVG